MNPLIFYRIRHPASNLAALPQISMNKIYDQSTAEEMIQFSVKTVQLGDQRGKKNYMSHISSEETRSNFAELMQFKADDDRQLIKSMDKYITDELANKAISEVSASEFDFKKFEMKNERLKTASKELLEMRCDLYLKFTK